MKMVNKIILILCVVSLLSIFGLCEEQTKPIDLTADNYEEMLQSDKLVVIDFWAEWCKYCKLLDPIIERLIVFNQQYNKDKIAWFKVDVDKSLKFNSNFRPFRGLPVIAFYKNGVEVDRIIGFHPFLAIQDKIKFLLKEEVKVNDKKKDNCNGGICEPPKEWKDGSIMMRSIGNVRIVAG